SFTSGAPTLGNFALGTVPTDNFGYSLAITSNQIDLIVGAPPVSAAWNFAGNGNYNDTTKFDPTQIPPGAGLTATFAGGTSNPINLTTVPSGAISVSVNGVFTEGTLVF